MHSVASTTNILATRLDRFLTSWRLRTYSAIVFIAIIALVALRVIAGEDYPGASERLRGADFLAVYSASQLANEGTPLDAYNYRLVFNQVGQQLGIPPTQLTGLPDFLTEWPIYLYSPPATIIFSWFARLPYSVALALWLLASFGALLLSIYLLRRCLSNLQRYPLWLLLALACCFWPLDVAFVFGQNSTFVLLLYTLSFYFTQPQFRRYQWAGGLSAAALALFKPELVVGLALVWLLTQQWRAIGSAIIGVAGAGLLALLVYPAEMYSAWLHNLVAMSSFDRTSAMANTDITIHILLQLLLPFATSLANAIYYLILVMAIVILTFFVLRLKRSGLGRERQHLWLYVLAICFSVTTPLYLQLYHLTLLLLPILLLFALYEQPHEATHMMLKLLTLLLYISMALTYLIAEVFRVQISAIFILIYIGYAVYLFVQDTGQVAGLVSDLVQDSA